jgi:hypothetical protein
VSSRRRIFLVVPDPRVWGPHAVEITGPHQFGQRPRVETIGLGPRLTDPGVTRRDDDHARHVRLDDPRDRPRIARDLPRDPVTRVEALPEQLQRLGPGLDPAGRAQPPLGDDRDLTEIAVDIPRYRLISPSSSRPTRGEPVGKRRRRIRAQSPSSKTACPACVLPKAPRRSRPNLGPRPDTTGPSREQFHAPSSGNAGGDRCSCTRKRYSAPTDVRPRRYGRASTR